MTTGDDLANPTTTTARSHHDDMSTQARRLPLPSCEGCGPVSHFRQGRHKGDENPTPTCRKTRRCKDPNADVSKTGTIQVQRRRPRYGFNTAAMTENDGGYNPTTEGTTQ